MLYSNTFILLLYGLLGWSPSKTLAWARKRYGFPDSITDLFYHESEIYYAMGPLFAYLIEVPWTIERDDRVANVLSNIFPPGDMLALPDLSTLSSHSLHELVSRYDWTDIRRQIDIAARG